MEDFKTELRALLIKYNAFIVANVGEGSDTYGIYDETLEVRENRSEKILFSISGWSIDADDLK